MLNKYDNKKKETISLLKRKAELDKELAKLPLKKYAQPIQIGWNVYVTLDSKYADEEKAFDLQQAIDIGFSTYQTKSVMKVKVIRKGYHGYYTTVDKRKVFVNLLPAIRKIQKEEYDKIPINLKKYFSVVQDELFKKYSVQRWELDISANYFQIKTSPNIVTHYRERGGPLEGELFKIEEKLYHTDKLYYRYVAKSSPYPRKYPKNKDRANLRTQVKKYLIGEKEDIDIPKYYPEYK